MNIDTSVDKVQELVQDDISAEPFSKRGLARRSWLRASDREPLKRQRSRSSSSAYLKSWGKIPEDAYRHVNELLGDVHPDTRHFYFHVLLSSRSWKYEEGWIPVPCEIIHRKVRKADIEELEAKGLLEVDRRYIPGIKSREYRIPIEIRRKFRDLCWEHRFGPKVNPFTGKRTQARDKSKLNDEHNNPYPELIRDAISHIEEGYFNGRKIDEYLAGLRAREGEAFERLEEARESREDAPVAYEKALREHQAAFGRLDNDQRCYEHLLNQEPEHVGEWIYRYRVAYRPQMSGRVSQVCGGLQSCSREMKAAAYTDLEDVHNYDIRSCHPCLLAAHLDDAGFDSSWLRTYLETQNAKVIYAERAGLSVDTWKTCLCALFMGAHLPKNILRGKGTIRKELELDAGDDLEAVYGKFKSVVEPLYKVLKKWHLYLDEVWVPANQYGGRGGLYVRNDTGSILNISDLDGARPDRRRSKLAAFLLQGKEAAFIHSLTLLSEAFEYQVIANEHDGLVTIGEIPPEAIDIVRKDRSMQYVEIVEKPFV